MITVLVIQPAHITWSLYQFLVRYLADFAGRIGLHQESVGILLAGASGRSVDFEYEPRDIKHRNLRDRCRATCARHRHASGETWVSLETTGEELLEPFAAGSA